MVETCVGPSGLHLKKELTALQKARFLRDPETYSYWTTPLSSRSIAAASSLNFRDGTRENCTKESNTGGLFESEAYSNLPMRGENRRKKVYLYNWGNHSSKSSDSGMKLEESGQGTVQGSPKGRLSNPQDVDSKSDTYLDTHITGFNAKTNPGPPVRRTTRKSRRSSASKHRPLRNSAISKLMDLPSSSLRALNCIEQSDETEYFNSGDLHQLTQNTGYASLSASPLLSGSCGRNQSASSKILTNIRRREESSYSYTPASTSSYRNEDCNPSTVGSWDGTTDEGEVDQVNLTRQQGCRLPRYSSKRTKGRSCGGWYSPSLSDTLRRKGSSIFCGSHTLSQRKRSSRTNKQQFLSKSSQGLPMLTNSCDGGGSSVDTASDELSTNFGELELEALSRLDGSRWSNCKSQEVLDLTSPLGDGRVLPDNRSLSQKYRPRSFDEIIGQNIVVQSLKNAIVRGRVAPAYLFHGPRGTGKTSSARIFAAALNCLSKEDNKPCGSCRACTDVASGNESNVREVDATNKKGVDKVRYLLKTLTTSRVFSPYKMFIIDECHMLSSKMWSAFIKFLEEPPSHVVFVFVTFDPETLPCAIGTRCQKYLFSKIKDADILIRLRRLCADEQIDVELDALDLISLNSDGSLQDAETMLDQLRLLGRRITTSLVNDLVGVVSDEKLLDLLETAMSSDTAETVRRSRELMASGVDPVALMSQLAGLIMDIIAGTYQLASVKSSDSVLVGRSLTDAELNRLQQALKILLDAEKQLRLSSERPTWFTAALLQLGSGHSSESTHSSSKSKTSMRKKAESTFDVVTQASVLPQSSSLLLPRVLNGYSSPLTHISSSMSTWEENSDDLRTHGQSVPKSLLAGNQKDKANGDRVFSCISEEKLDVIWRRCIEKCHSKTLRQLLCTHGKLISVSEAHGVLIAFIAFGDGDIKSRAERFLRSITNSIEIVLRRNVEVRIGLLPNDCMIRAIPDSPTWAQTETNELLDKEMKKDSNRIYFSSPKDSQKESLSLPRKSVDNSEGKRQRTLDILESSRLPDESFQMGSLPIFSTEGTNGACVTNDDSQQAPMQSKHAEATDEQQRLESAWLQIAEKGVSGSSSSLKTEKNQIVLHSGINHQNPNVSTLTLAVSSKHWEDQLNQEIKALKVNSSQGPRTEQIAQRVDRYSISPSLLHKNSLPIKENQGYESGPGCSGLLCWKTSKAHREKVKHGSHSRSLQTGRHSWFGDCGRLKAPDSRLRR